MWSLIHSFDVGLDLNFLILLQAIVTGPSRPLMPGAREISHTSLRNRHMVDLRLELWDRLAMFRQHIENNLGWCL
jgi:hypothetical protein